MNADAIPIASFVYDLAAMIQNMNPNAAFEKDEKRINMEFLIK
jgi:hypothetical protein